MLLTSAYVGSRRNSGPMSFAMCPCAGVPGPSGARTGTDGEGGSGMLTVPPGFLALTWHFRMLFVVAVSLVAGSGIGLGAEASVMR
jgi:hypothetical protein